MSKITIGQVDDFSGGYAGVCKERRDGILDYLQYVNTKLGGIQGHPIEMKVIDGKLDPSLTLAGWNTLRDAGAPFIVAYMSVVLPVLWPAANKDKIPMMAAAGDEDNVFPKDPASSYFYATAADTISINLALYDLMAADWAKTGKAGTPKLGVATMDISTMAPQTLNTTKFWTAKTGWEFKFTTNSPAPTDVSTQVMVMKNFGADYMFINGSAPAAVAWIKELARQNFHPKVYASSGFSIDVFKATAPASVGMISFQPNLQWTDSDPLVQLGKTLNSQYHPDVAIRTGDYLHGIADATAFCEALNRAQKTAGTAALTGPMVKAALETISNFDVGMGKGFTWTSTDRQGVPSVRFYQYTAAGIMAPVGGWATMPVLTAEQRTNAYWLK